jgi:division protein CdvB (Snf7/Vps24/ESCRT-III family)
MCYNMGMLTMTEEQLKELIKQVIDEMNKDLDEADNTTANVAGYDANAFATKEFRRKLSTAFDDEK